MRVCVIAAMLAVLALARTSVAASADPAGPDVVGRAGSPRTFRFEGCQAFSPAKIAAALECSVDVQVASIPGAPIDDYLSAVQRAVTAGYWNAGYLNAKVTAERDPASGAIVVRVAESTRFTCGPVRVVGARTLPVDRLVAKLTAAQPATLFPQDFSPKDGAFRVRAVLEAKDPELPAWSTGEPVKGDSASIQALREAVRRAGCELGYFDLWAECRITADAPASTLEVNVRSEGPRAVLDAVDVAGARKNTPERVVKLAGLEVGKPLDLVGLREVQQRLWDAARFTDHTLYAEPRRGDPSRMRVRIELREYEHAPRLDEPFSPVEQAALRFQQWGMGIRDRGDELLGTFRSPAGSVDFATGHRHGFVARVQGVAGDDTAQWGVFATDSAVGVSAKSDGRVFRTGVPPFKLHTDLVVGPSPDPQDGREMSIGLNFGANNKPRPETPPLELRPALAPVAFVALVHRADCTFEIRDGVLVGTGQALKRLAVDAATGRLLELQASSEDGTTVGKVGLKDGAVDEMVASLTQGTTNVYDAAAPVASLLRFAATQAINVPALVGLERPPARPREAAAAGGAAGKLLTNDAMAALEPVAASLLAAMDPRGFGVPPPPLAEQRAPKAYAVGPALHAVDDLFPRASWPWTLGRLELLVPTGEYRGTQEEVARLMASDEVGPIGYLAAAELLARVNPAMAPPFAQRGLQRLEVEWFEKDVDQLLREGFPPAEVLGRLATNLRGLTPAEVKALSAELPPEIGERLWRLADALRLRPDAPPQELLRSALRDGWSRGLREVVEARLQALKTAPPAQP